MTDDEKEKKRDRLACEVMWAVLMRDSEIRNSILDDRITPRETAQRRLAERAYEMADAMLKAKGNP